MTPAEKLIIRTVENELDDDTSPVVAIERAATKLGLTFKRVMGVYSSRPEDSVQ